MSTPAESLESRRSAGPPPRPLGFRVTFSESGKTVFTDGQFSLLDLAEAHGVSIARGCSGGGCGRCKVLCLSGEVDMECEDGLELDEKIKGFVLSCIGCARSNVIIDA